MFISLIWVTFSAMNRILSWARNSLDSSLANDFMLLSMNKDLLKAYGSKIVGVIF
jgi:hypothetical protein